MWRAPRVYCGVEWLQLPDLEVFKGSRWRLYVFKCAGFAVERSDRHVVSHSFALIFVQCRTKTRRLKTSKKIIVFACAKTFSQNCKVKRSLSKPGECPRAYHLHGLKAVCCAKNPMEHVFLNCWDTVFCRDIPQRTLKKRSSPVNALRHTVLVCGRRGHYSLRHAYIWSLLGIVCGSVLCRYGTQMLMCVLRISISLKTCATRNKCIRCSSRCLTGCHWLPQLCSFAGVPLPPELRKQQVCRRVLVNISRT